VTRKILILGILLFLIFHTPVSSEDAVTLSQFKKTADLASLNILAVSAINFKPVDSTTYQTFEWEWNQIGITVPNGNPESLSLLAQFDLPDGAEIKKVYAIYYDNSTDASIDIGIGATKPFDTSEPGFMVFFTSDGLPNSDSLRTFNTNTITDPIIDNTNIYFALVEFDDNTFGDVAFRTLYIAYK
jgi:hypothetical protein